MTVDVDRLALVAFWAALRAGDRVHVQYAERDELGQRLERVLPRDAIAFGLTHEGQRVLAVERAALVDQIAGAIPSARSQVTRAPEGQAWVMRVSSAQGFGFDLRPLGGQTEG